MPSAHLRAVTVDTSGLDARLRSLRRDEIPFAKMLALNDLSKDTIRIEKLEMLEAFDRPKPFVLGGLRQLKYAKKKETNQSAIIGFTDISGRFGRHVEDIVRTHIQGTDRGTKAAEGKLRRAGIIRQNEFLVRGRKSRTDVYGNITRKTWQSALTALASGNILKSRWHVIGSLGGDIWEIRWIGKIRAILWTKGKRADPVLVWIVTTDRPDYRKRFDFYGEAQEHARRFAPHFAENAVRKALKTARS